jgi:hypothetical protein
MSLSMHLSRGRVFAVLASLAVLLGVGSTARAAETVDVAARIAAMNTAASNATSAITERQTRAINKMTELDTQGKPDVAIRAAGKVGKKAVEEAAERGRREVRKISSRTLVQLTKQNADAAVKAQVEAARDTSLSTINNAVLAAKAAINAKADELTGASG